MDMAQQRFLVRHPGIGAQTAGHDAVEPTGGIASEEERLALVDLRAVTARQHRVPEGLVLLGEPAPSGEDALQRCEFVGNVVFSTIGPVGSL